MNKKFLKITLLMTLIFFLFLITFKSLTGKIVTRDNANDNLFDICEAIIKYEGFEENENMTIIKVSIKNNSDFYASLNDVYITFRSSNYVINDEGWQTNLPSPQFEGRDSLFNIEDEYQNYSHYFEPGETKVYEFEIAKAINFDEKYFDTNRFTLSGNIKFYKYKLNDNVVAKLVGNRSGGLEFLENSKDPYVID